MATTEANLPHTIAWGPRPNSRSGNTCGLASLRFGGPGAPVSNSPSGGGAGAAARARRKKLARLGGDSDQKIAVTEGGMQVCVRPGQILVPGLGPSNDMARARNGGQRRGSWVEALAATASEPWLMGPTTAPAVASSAWGCSSVPFTPRTIRGTVRKSSKVDMTYPGQPSCRPSSSASMRQGSKASMSAPRLSSSGTTNQMRSVPSLDEPEDPKMFALKRSLELMHSLYKVRRAGVMQEVDECPDVSPEEILMTATLREVEDTEASLTKLEEILMHTREPLQPLGGARHPTSVISQRTLDVVRRKRKILHDLEARIMDFEAAQTCSEAILESIKLDPYYTPPEELVGLDKVAKEHVHKNGNPADEVRADFSTFSATFGLPQGHEIFRRMERLASQAVSWWAQAAVKEAQQGTETTAVHRIVNIAVSILGRPDHEAIRKCRKFLGESIAENTLANAEVLVQKDRELVASSVKAQPESAKVTGDWIMEEIKSAISMGAPPRNLALGQARRLAEELLKDFKERMARKVLEFAVSQKEKDEANALRSVGNPQVGPAAWAADAIDRELRKALEADVPESHPLLKDARNLMKELRDEDNIRKRVAARESRNFRNS